MGIDNEFKPAAIEPILRKINSNAHALPSVFTIHALKKFKSRQTFCVSEGGCHLAMWRGVTEQQRCGRTCKLRGKE
jgi:hypothetical protein